MTKIGRHQKFVIPEGARERPAPEPTRCSEMYEYRSVRDPAAGNRSRRDPPRLSGSPVPASAACPRSEEHTSELQSLMRISYAVFCLKKKTTIYKLHTMKVELK